MIEFIILMGPMLFISFLVIQAGLTFYARSGALAAATVGVNLARQHEARPGAAQRAANDFLGDLPVVFSGSDVRVEVVGDVATVRVTLNVLNVLPIPQQIIEVLPTSLFSVTEEASRPVERFIP